MHYSNLTLFSSDGDLISSDWNGEHNNGQDYMDAAGRPGSPDLFRRMVNPLAPKIEAANRFYAKKFGWGDADKQPLGKISIPEEAAKALLRLGSGRLIKAFVRQTQMKARAKAQTVAAALRGRCGFKPRDDIDLETGRLVAAAG